MIDPDKYEGHTRGAWMWYQDDGDTDLVVAEDVCVTVIEEVKALNNKANAQLIVDAPLLLAEVKRLRDELNEANQVGEALWNVLDNWSICMDDYSMHDLYENLDERYAWADWGIILKELYTHTEEDGWQPKEAIE
tara:strand:+ start:38 stop:442 length:405 start_codon:yes stop_codon:yes gene_type:complete